MNLIGHAPDRPAGLKLEAVTEWLAATVALQPPLEFTRIGNGQSNLTYLVSDTNKLKIGYLHTIEPVSVFGSYTDHRAYGETRLLLSGRLQLHASVAADFISFTNSPRNDTDFSVVVEPEYQVTKWMIVTLGYRLDLRSSNQSTVSLNFARHEPYLRVLFIY